MVIGENGGKGTEEDNFPCDACRKSVNNNSALCLLSTEMISFFKMWKSFILVIH